MCAVYRFLARFLWNQEERGIFETYIVDIYWFGNE
jgi:hypothetical protein